MHEFSLAVGIVKSVMKAVEEHKVTKITEVNLEMGELMLVNQDQLDFCFEVASDDSIVKGAELKIHLKPAKIRCNTCSYIGGVEREEEQYPGCLMSLQCPNCKGFSIELLEGKEFNVKDLKADVEE